MAVVYFSLWRVWYHIHMVGWLQAFYEGVVAYILPKQWYYHYDHHCMEDGYIAAPDEECMFCITNREALEMLQHPWIAEGDQFHKWYLEHEWDDTTEPLLQ